MTSADDETREEISASNRNADIHQPENPRKKRNIVPPETASSALMKYITETASSALMKYITENNKILNDYKHPIHAFLEGLAPTLKNLPPYHQHLAKGKIFSVVQELEGQAFFGSPAATPHSSRDSWDNSSSATEIADINITALTPQQPSTRTLAPYYQNSHTHSN
jgi:hypothetical protein